MCVLLLLLFSAHAGAQAPGAVEELPAAIVLKPLFAQRVQILDVAVLSPRGLLVLDRAGVTRYEQEEELSLGQTTPRWRRVESASLPARAWPRDLRGHLVSDKGYGVLLPGVNCTAQLNPLRMTCVEGRAPWPLLLPNSGLEPERNYFTTPDGMTFYSGANGTITALDIEDPSAPRILWVNRDYSPHGMRLSSDGGASPNSRCASSKMKTSLGSSRSPVSGRFSNNSDSSHKRTLEYSRGLCTSLSAARMLMIPRLSIPRLERRRHDLIAGAFVGSTIAFSILLLTIAFAFWRQDRFANQPRQPRRYLVLPALAIAHFTVVCAVCGGLREWLRID